MRRSDVPSTLCANYNPMAPAKFRGHLCLLLLPRRKHHRPSGGPFAVRRVVFSVLTRPRTEGTGHRFLRIGSRSVEFSRDRRSPHIERSSSALHSLTCTERTRCLDSGDSV